MDSIDFKPSAVSIFVPSWKHVLFCPVHPAFVTQGEPDLDPHSELQLGPGFQILVFPGSG